VGMLAKIRRMHLREQLSLHEIARRTGLARNTIKTWLRKAGVTEPRYPKREVATKLDEFADTLETWLKADAHRGRRERRTVWAMFQDLRARGYKGGYGRVAAFARRHREEQRLRGSGGAFVPLRFALGEAFQFDWSTEYAFVAGLRRRLEVAHTKLCASRAFWLTAYPGQSHEMLFDAHARAFAAFEGIPERGIYDNMKTAVDRVGRGKLRTVNARFEAMTSHYLFEPEFCNVASGWEKGIVEKNVQDRRREIWREAAEQRWPSLEALNTWLAERCRQAWEEMKHPEWPELTLGELLQDERARMMPNPKPFDGYVELPARVSSTSLVHFERNRYSVPTRFANHVVSLRSYALRIEVVADGERVATHERSFEREQTIYDWRHYVELIERKPGALRNGAPFTTLPEPLKQLQGHLLRRPGGDRVMAQFLAAVPVHGLEAILEATQEALAIGKPSAEHVLNLLTRLKERSTAKPGLVKTELALKEEPRADLDRYDRLREAEDPEPVPPITLTALLIGVVTVLVPGGGHVG
jgi:transposase